jgi:arylsulfatase A-like enzyme
MKRIISGILRFLKKRKLRKLFFSALFIIISGIAAFILWWDYIFFPDDFKITEKEALEETASLPFKKISYDLLKGLDTATLTGDFSSDRILKIIDGYKKAGFLIKEENICSGVNSNLIYRAGTGHVGIWVDERSSILILPGTAITFNVTVSVKDEISLSALSYGTESVLKMKIENGKKPVQEDSIKLKSYTTQYKNRDVKIKFNNRGYKNAVTDTGWFDRNIVVNGDSSVKNQKLKLTFTVPSDSGPVFIANPKIYTDSERKKYNVIYIIFDGVAQRYWSFHNDKSDLTNFMKENGEKDYIIFDNMVTIGNKTRIALSGLFTSKISTETRHGINRNYIPPEERQIFYKYLNQGKLVSLPDYFRKEGYISAQFGNSGFTVELLSSGMDYGFEKSFEFQYNPYDTYGISHQFFRFLRENKNRNFFVYCHYNTPHKPFYAPIKYYFKSIFESPIEGLWRPDFTGCISYTDDAYRNIYTALKKNGLLENSIVVIATDHGSGFELSTFDGGFHYNDYTKQVFMIHVPDTLKKELSIPGGRRDVYISSINIAPTLLQLAGLEVPRQFSGRSFVPVLKNEYKQKMWDESVWCLGRKDISLITPDLKKYILTGIDSDRFVKRKYVICGDEVEKSFESLYDISRDPYEYDNLIKTDRILLGKMRRIFFEADIHHPEKTVLTFIPDKKKSCSITVKIKTATRLLRAELYSEKMDVLKEYSVIRGNTLFSFNLGREPLYFIFEQENDRVPLSVEILTDGVRINKNQIYATQLDVNLFNNPVDLRTVDDFRILYTDKLPLQKGWTGNNGKDVSVKISRVDLHRWIDLGKSESMGLSASMKETLKSWGYIQ